MFFNRANAKACTESKIHKTSSCRFGAVSFTLCVLLLLLFCYFLITSIVKLFLSGQTFIS